MLVRFAKERSVIGPDLVSRRRARPRRDSLPCVSLPLLSVTKGTVIAGKYVLEESLAAGGMGSVWRAKHLDLDVDVAIKLIAVTLSSNQAALARFKREARAAAQLR